MNISIQDITPVKKELHIEVSQTELKPHFDKAYQKFQKTAKVPGFRPGKVPMSMIEKMYGASLQYKEIENIAQLFYQDALKEKELKPIARPAMKNIDFQPETPLKFVVAYDVKPEVVLGNYKNLKFKKTIETVTEEDIQIELDYVLRQNSQIKEVTDRGLEREDICVLKLDEVDENGAATGKSLKDKIFRFDGTEFSEADKEKLVGKKIDESAVLDLIEPDKEPKKVSATLKTIYTFAKPELTDEFVVQFTQNKFHNVADFKVNLTELIEKTKKDAGERTLEESVINELTKSVQFEIPETLVESFLDSMIEEEAHKNKNHELPAGFDSYEYKNKNRTIGEKSAKWFLIKEAIISTENLTVSEEDLNQYLEEIAAKEKLPVQTLKNYYRTERMKEQLENMLLTKKVFEVITKNAKIEEISMVDWQKQNAEKQ